MERLLTFGLDTGNMRVRKCVQGVDGNISYFKHRKGYASSKENQLTTVMYNLEVATIHLDLLCMQIYYASLPDCVLHTPIIN